ncbi:MAG: Fic family protein [Pseudomonas sp.]
MVFGRVHESEVPPFLVSDVHPFNDGNGRMARVVMATELAKPVVEIALQAG